MREALYLFCLSRAGSAAQVKEAGLDAQGAFLHLFQGLAAVLSWVPLEDFSGPEAERRLQDLSWLGPQAIRHEAVVDGVMRFSPVLPVRFGALFSSLEALERFLAPRHATIARFLDEMDNKEEWALKGLLDKDKGTQWLLSSAASSQDAEPPLSPGARYLQERRLRAGTDGELRQWAAQTCQRIAQELSRYAVAASRRQTVFYAGAGQPVPVASLAFLLMRGSIATFRECAEQANAAHAHCGLVFQISGPWPPYSFCPVLEMQP